MTTAFLFQPAGHPKTTRLFLEDRIANMIDEELYRLEHKDEFDKKAAEDFRKAVEEHASDVLPSNFEASSYVTDEFVSPRERRRDERMAKINPQAYCVDRCIATGNCDVFEDIFEMSPKEVIQFCDECVLSEDEEPCDVPEAMLNAETAMEQLRKSIEQDSKLKP
eukprot:CAMPEP_0195267766 /NCGR_PEP_ID=MMETSP0706-20130129/12776_1 /TAXON_ID=33640 /ORGANISM="Asterionellopsis glacialis, Strain CCMP134" /LENGTH=164 /DNA_ID=CAMNT_0040322561 /DNA_START=260 /DNA_END=754 /DNA_ORIENTATION=-